MEALAGSLQKETQELLNDSRIAPRSVVLLRLAKAQHNCEKLRSLVGVDRRVLTIQDQLLSIEFWAEAESRAASKLSEHHHNKSSENLDQTQDSKPDNDMLLDELNALPGESELRQRRPIPTATRLEVQEKDQNDLSADILEMVRQIKTNAEQFAAKLDTDNDLVGATTDAISRTAGSMTAVGSKLMKYRRSSAIGWMFYIWSALFIIGAVIGGMVIIQLFPKW